MTASVMCFRTLPWSYSRGAEISDQLVNSDLPLQNTPAPLFTPLPDGNYQCNGYAQCNGTYKCRSFKHPQTGIQIPIKDVITCSTKTVIYLITCRCGKNDVGKTKRKLKVGISEHRSTIRCKNSTYPVATLFAFGSEPLDFIPTLYWQRTCHPQQFIV